jgi:MFS family permease
MARFKWAVLIALCSGQFVMVLDSTVMNVSIQRVIEDLDTKVSAMQLAIATYTLTTAALMLVGGKVGDIIGRRLAFQIGLVTFGAGALVTALSQNIGILILGWSILEAVGAALMIPAILALIAANYRGADRVIAFGAIGGIAGAAAAAGPMIGGFVATVGSWRDVFAAEAVIMVCLLGTSRIIADAPLGRARPRLDVIGAVLSTAGLALAVLGVVQASTWGWITPKEVPSVGGTPIEPFGLSVVPFLIVAGLTLIGAFAAWERRESRAGRDTLVELAMLRLPQLRAGLGTITVMFFCLGGIFFLLVLTIDPDFDALPFAGSVLVVGVGLGLIGSQVSNVNLSTAGPDKTSETGALQGTGQNLGAALGTAVIGSILLSFLTATFDHRVEGDKALPYGPRHEIREKTSEGLAFIPAEAAGAELKQKGVPAPVVSQLEANYAQSQVDALKIAVGAVALVALLGLAGVTRRLPATPLRGPPSAAA